jgi:hypothetical protein
MARVNDDMLFRRSNDGERLRDSFNKAKKPFSMIPRGGDADFLGSKVANPFRVINFVCFCNGDILARLAAFVNQNLLLTQESGKLFGYAFRVALKAKLTLDDGQGGRATAFHANGFKFQRTTQGEQTKGVD